MPSMETFEAWRKNTPPDFLFAVKGSRYITHMKKLKDVGEGVEWLISNASALGKKLGPILFQLPPGWKVNTERLEDFLRLLPRDHRFTIEFRNNTWYTEEVYDLLRKYNCAFCIYELSGHQSPREVTADFVYIRLHGPGGKYQGSYSSDVLDQWSRRIQVWRRAGIDVYVYFDNDEKGYAAFNAKHLAELVEL
jgi:uncharacterized protein YecE (DUF72 family)